MSARIIKLAAAAAAALSMSACEVINESESNIHVRYDEGGSIQKYQRDIARYNALGQIVVIDGKCMSACTMFLGADNVCVTPRAEFLFHGAIPTAIGETRKNQNAVMAAYYPEPLRKWFYESGASQYTVVFMELEREKAMELSGVGYCKSVS